MVISAAGIGSRLDYGMPKCLVPICGRPLLAWQLDAIASIDPDVEIVVVAGYRAADVARFLREVAPGVPVVLNHRFASTGTSGSLRRGARMAGGEFVVSLDGDLLISPEELRPWIEGSGRAIGVSPRSTRTPVVVRRDDADLVVEMGFDLEGDLEWNGLLRLPREIVIEFGDDHVFWNLQRMLPLPSIASHTVEIDDPDDLDRAETWLTSRLEERTWT
ncbi:MAG: NTP transferase domain-containing protein [Protaetiibacter sp.]